MPGTVSIRNAKGCEKMFGNGFNALESATTGLCGIEAICTANAIKYLWRWKLKNGVQDLEKAKWYIDKLIEKQKEMS